MIYRLANVIYWICCAVAALSMLGALAVVAGYLRVYESTLSLPDTVFIGSALAGFALLSWLTGRATRYILAGT